VAGETVPPCGVKHVPPRLGHACGNAAASTGIRSDAKGSGVPQHN